MRRRALRTARALLVTALALEGAYVAGMNLFLSTGLFARVVDAHPLDVDIHYTRAWSLIPTLVHAEGLTIRGTDSNVEWILRLDEVTFDCAARYLVQKKLWITRARGSGITFRVRRKVPSPAATPEWVDQMPPIDGLGALGFKPMEPPYAGEWSDRDWHLFTVHLDDVVAEHVREVWVDDVRAVGDLSVRGGFYLKPIRSVQVGPLTIDVRDGTVARDSLPVVERAALRVRLTIDALDPRLASGDDILHSVSLETEGSLRLPDLAKALDLPAYGEATIPRLEVRLRRGILQTGTRIEVGVDSLQVTAGRHIVTMRLDASASVAGDHLAATATVTDADVDAVLSSPRIAVTADSAALDVADPLADLHGVLDAAEIDVPDARRMSGWLPDRVVSVQAGHAHGSARVEGWRDGGRLAAEAHVDAAGLDVGAGAARLRGDASADLVLRRQEGATWEGVLDARSPHAALEGGGWRVRAGMVARVRAHDVDFDGGTLALDEARADLTRVEVLGASGPAGTVDRASVTARSARLALVDPLRRLDVDARVDGGRLVDASALHDLVPSAPRLTSDDGRFRVSLTASANGGSVRGGASFATHGIGFVTKRLHVTGEVSGVARLDALDLRSSRVRGSVELTADHAHGGSDAARDEFAADRIVVSASVAALDLGSPSLAAMDAHLHVEHAALDDARSLNAFLPSPDVVAFESGSAVVRADLGFRAADRAAGGTLDATLVRTGIKLHETHLVGDFAIQVQLRRVDPVTGTLDVAGTHVAMREVAITGASTDATRWQGDLLVQRGQLALSASPRLDADLVLHARDARPILAALLGNSLPPFLVGLTDMPHLDAVSHLVVEPSALVLSDLSASGGDIALRGVYAVRDGVASGGFVVEKGPVSLGVHIGPGGSAIQAFGLDAWLRAQIGDAMRIARCAPRDGAEHCVVP